MAETQFADVITAAPTTSTRPKTKAASKKRKPALAAVKAPERTPLPPPAPVLSQSELDHAIKGLAVEHIQCRDFGHSWRPLHARWVARDRCFEVEMRCGRCTTLRTRLLGERGQLIGSKYDYVDGYQIKGAGRLEGADRDLIRLQSINAILVTDTVEAD